LSALKMRGFPLDKTTRQRPQSRKDIGCDVIASRPRTEREMFDDLKQE